MANDWTEDQDVIVGLLARTEASVEEIKDAGKILEIDFSAMNMRVSNYKSLQGKSGLSNVSKQTKRVYEELKKLTFKECEEMLKEELRKYKN